MMAITMTLPMSLRAIIDMQSALHTTVDMIVRFSTPTCDATIPIVERPTKEAAFKITS